MTGTGQSEFDQITVRIRVEDEEDLEIVRSAASKSGIQLKEPTRVSVVEPITFVLAVGGVIALGTFVLDMWERLRQKRKGAVVVDLREGAKDQLYRDSDLPYGYVVTFLADGKVTIEIKDSPKDHSAQLVGEIVSGAYKTVKDLAEAAAKVVGGDKVRTEPAPTGD